MQVFCILASMCFLNGYIQHSHTNVVTFFYFKSALGLGFLGGEWIAETFEFIIQ